MKILNNAYVKATLVNSKSEQIFALFEPSKMVQMSVGDVFINIIKSNKADFEYWLDDYVVQFDIVQVTL
jgi:uncharacterized protein YeeX (DUF496 family)